MAWAHHKLAIKEPVRGPETMENSGAKELKGILVKARNVLALVLCVIAPFSACGAVIGRVETSDGSRIEMRQTVPNFRPRAVILIANGTDGGFRFNSQTEAIYLEKSLSTAGFAVVGYLNRGFSDLDSCMPGVDETNADPMVIREIINKCYRQSARAKVDFASNREDLRAAWRAALKISDRLEVPIYILAISEGIWHVAWLVEQEKRRPAVIFGLSTPIESAKKTMEWQLGDGPIIDFAEKSIQNAQGGYIDVEALQGLASSLGFSYSIGQLRDEVFHINLIWSQTIFAARQDMHTKAVRRLKDVMSKPRSAASFRQVSATKQLLVYESNGWVQDGLTEDVSPLGKFTNLHIPTVFFWGERDLQIPVLKYKEINVQNGHVIPNVDHVMHDASLRISQPAIEFVTREISTIIDTH